MSDHLAEQKSDKVAWSLHFPESGVASNAFGSECAFICFHLDALLKSTVSLFCKLTEATKQL